MPNLSCFRERQNIGKLLIEVFIILRYISRIRIVRAVPLHQAPPIKAGTDRLHRRFQLLLSMRNQLQKN